MQKILEMRNQHSSIRGLDISSIEQLVYYVYFPIILEWWITKYAPIQWWNQKNYVSKI